MTWEKTVSDMGRPRGSEMRSRDDLLDCEDFCLVSLDLVHASKRNWRVDGHDRCWSFAQK